MQAANEDCRTSLKNGLGIPQFRGEKKDAEMEFVSSAAPVVGIILAILVAIGITGMALRAGINAAAWVGMAFTTLAVAVQIAPGLHAGDRAMVGLGQADERSDSRSVDRMREKVRRDILARTDMFLSYPHETVRVTKRVRHG